MPSAGRQNMYGLWMMERWWDEGWRQRSAQGWRQAVLHPTGCAASAGRRKAKLCSCPALPWRKLAPEQNHWARACLGWTCQGAGCITGMQVHSYTGWSGCEARSQTGCQKLCRLPPAQLWTTMWTGRSGNTHPTHLTLPVWNPLRTQNMLRMCTTASVPDRQLELLHEGDLGMEEWPLQMITISCCHCYCLFWLW